jgi:predicted nucleotidyltransferase
MKISDEMIVDRILKALPEVWAIYRFGSAGTPFEHAGSDIDLAILAPRPIASVACWELAQDLARQFKRDVDLVDLQSASVVLRQQVFGHDRRIYCSDRFRCEEFESRALSDYVRLNEARRNILGDIHERGRIHAR